MHRFKRLLLFPAFTFLLFAGQVRAVPVTLELALVLDISGSVDKDEYILLNLIAGPTCIKPHQPETTLIRGR